MKKNKQDIKSSWSQESVFDIDETVFFVYNNTITVLFSIIESILSAHI